MAAATLVVHDDARFFEQALQEYREAVGDYSKFLDLHVETQQRILERAQQLNVENPDDGVNIGCLTYKQTA